MQLGENNGLYNAVSKLVEADNFEMHYEINKGHVSVFYKKLKDGLNREQLKIKIADYIGSHMLHESYKTVSMYQW